MVERVFQEVVNSRKNGGMKETIELLKELQEKDIKISEAQKTIERIPNIIKEGEEEIQALKKELEEKIHLLAELKKEFRRKERDLMLSEDKIKGFKSRLHEIKTKKELDALDEEIKKQQELKERLEEDSLLLMEDIEAKEQEIENKGKEVQIKEDLFKKSKEENEKALKEATCAYKILLSSREEIAKKIEKRVLELYETIRKNKDNIALANVDNNICSVCQIAVRPQIINEIKEGNEIIRCESCLRILYI